MEKDLDALVERYLKPGSERLPCLALAVCIDGQTKYKQFHGWENEKKGKKLSESSIFWVASCTKFVTGVASMQLYEQGLWKLDDEVAKFVPSFASLPGVAMSEDSKELEPLQRPILMRDIATHTAGLLPLATYPQLRDGRKNVIGARFFKTLWRAPQKNLADFVDLLASFPLVHQPGVAWEYGFSIDVLGRVVEVISGMGFDEYCDKYIFAPLGMTSTCFEQRATADQHERMVVPFSVDTGKLFTDPKKFFKGEVDGPFMVKMKMQDRISFTTRLSPMIMPGGGLQSTVDDWMKLVQCMLDGGVGGPNSQRILREESVRLFGQDLLPRECTHRLTTSIINGRRRDDLAAGQSVAVACVADPERTPMAQGAFEWGGISSTIFWADPANKLAVVCFTQIGPFPVYPIRSELKDIIYKYVGDSSQKNLRSKL